MLLSSPPESDAEPALLRICQLTLKSASQTVLDAVDMAIYSGERVAILGPSGTGKSLLARAITGILPNDVCCEGQIVLNGYDITCRHPALRPSAARVSMVDQDTSTALSPFHTLGQQLMMVCAGAGQSGCALRWRAEALLEQVGLSRDIMRRYPGEISGGQRQRVCIALALACDTSLLVADEPTSALDAVNQQHVLHALISAVPDGSANELSGLSFLKRIRSTPAAALAAYTSTSSRPKALLFITHDLKAAQQLCDRALVLYEGKIVESASMSALLNNPQHAFTQRMVAAWRQEQSQLSAVMANNSLISNSYKSSGVS